ncbi:MAG: hypothetical protein PHW63_04940 [Alphaproteobacteria bacterium]|nr:hypothetical protein [Alphaproteobacteria bacterium]
MSNRDTRVIRETDYFDPLLLRTMRTAMRRMVGDDSYLVVHTGGHKQDGRRCVVYKTVGLGPVSAVLLKSRILYRCNVLGGCKQPVAKGWERSLPRYSYTFIDLIEKALVQTVCHSSIRKPELEIGPTMSGDRVLYQIDFPTAHYKRCFEAHLAARLSTRKKPSCRKLIIHLG